MAELLDHDLVTVPEAKREHVAAPNMVSAIAAERGLEGSWYQPLDQEQRDASTKAFVRCPDLRGLEPMVERILDLRGRAWAGREGEHHTAAHTLKQ